MRSRAPAGAWAAFLLLALTAGAHPAAAQIVLSNLLEAQGGNTPFADPHDRTDLYSALDLDYLLSGGRVGLRFETHRNSEDQFDYEAVTRRYAEWGDPRLRVRVGHLYTILGRGILHRSFDLPGVVLDQPGVRSRYAPSRDVDGALVEAGHGWFGVRAFAGTPNGGEFSPAEPFGDFRYGGQLAGGQLTVAPLRALSVGAAGLRSSVAGGAVQVYGSGFLEADPLALLAVEGVSLPLYVEYARGGRRVTDWWSFGTAERDTHALYAAVNLLWGPAAVSAEWKDYTGFRLGTNDPPSLVREHAPALLNRNTHVLDAERERGFQLEGTVAGPEGIALTANLSRADGRGGSFAMPVGVRYDERYLEIHAAPPRAEGWDATLFHARGQDSFVGVPDRTLAGGSVTVPLPHGLAVTLDVQHQRARRVDTPFDDLYAALGVARAGWGSFTMVRERSTDPEQDPDWLPGAAVSPRRFLGAVLAGRVAERHEVSLFAGERRGGRACTAGTCYEVLSFRGVELRIASRL